MDLLKLRPMQFCLFLKALVGVEEMERAMVEAIGVAKDSLVCEAQSLVGLITLEDEVAAVLPMVPFIFRFAVGR